MCTVGEVVQIENLRTKLIFISNFNDYNYRQLLWDQWGHVFFFFFLNHNSLKHINKDEGVVKLNSLDKVE